MVQEYGTAALNGFAHSLDLVNGYVVHQQDLTSLQGGNENLFDIGPKVVYSSTMRTVSAKASRIPVSGRDIIAYKPRCGEITMCPRVGQIKLDTAGKWMMPSSSRSAIGSGV
jgi:hypothetical protein